MLHFVEVSSKQEVRQFLDFPKFIYKNDAEWIHPLDKDIEAVFDKKKNKFYRHGDCIRYNVFKNHQQVGRFAVFYNQKQKLNLKTGGIGFFECIDQQEVANSIFDKAKEWLQKRGYEAMDGPINFGERDKFWGLLVEGFKAPLYGMNYNPPYYVDLFKNYGFETYFEQLCFGLKVEDHFQEKWIKRAEKLAHDHNYSLKNVNKKNLTQFAKDFTYIYNKAWKSHAGNKTLNERQAIKMFETMKPVMDENISWFAYYKGEPIGCWVNLPDLNEYFKFLNGQFGLWHQLKFLYYKNTVKTKRIVGIVFGVIPEFQGKGVDNYMVVQCTRQFLHKTHYQDYEMQWIGDFNPKMINIANHLGAEVTRKLITCRKIFDPTIPFERYPIIQ